MDPTLAVGIFVALIAIVLTVVFSIFSGGGKEQVADVAGERDVPKGKAPGAGGRGPGKGRKAPGKLPGAEKVVHAHHPLDLNTLKGHTDPILGLAFSFDGRALATACEDGLVRVFKLEDVAAKSFKFLRLAMPPGVHTPRGVAFGEGSGQLLVSASDSRGGCILMFGPGSGQEAEVARAQGKLPAPEVKWEKRRAHDGKDIASTVSAPATFGTGDGSSLAATCALDGTDVRIWHVTDGKLIAKVDSNQLQNNMAALSPDGRFLAAAAFTADVKVWELLYAKDGSVRDVTKVMQLKGHKSAVTWLSFSWDGQRVVTTSKDGTIKLWNLDVRYLLSEDPKCLKTWPIPEPPFAEKQKPHVLDRVALSPDNSVLAVTFGPHLQWLDMVSGAVLNTAENAHDGKILWMAWSPKPHRTEKGLCNILATCGVDKKVKLWRQPDSAP